MKTYYVKTSDLPYLYSLPKEGALYVKLNPRFRTLESVRVFKAFISRWRQDSLTINRRDLTLAKIRTTIIRSCMNQLIDVLEPPAKNEPSHVRINRTLRERYIKANIPFPPPRVNNSYLEMIFKNLQIRHYYNGFLERGFEAFL